MRWGGHGGCWLGGFWGMGVRNGRGRAGTGALQGRERRRGRLARFLRFLEMPLSHLNVWSGGGRRLGRRRGDGGIGMGAMDAVG
jgi:hypothetical protein